MEVRKEIGTRPKVLLTRALTREAMGLLQHNFDLTVGNDHRMLTRGELLEKVRGKDALITMLADRVDGKLLDAAPGLKIVANYAVGYNNIEVPATLDRGIPVIHTPGVLTQATADTAFALLLAVARRIVEAHAYVVSGKFTAWKPDLLLGLELTGKQMGIVGMGRIGQAFAARCLGFGMKIYYTSRSRLPKEREETLKAKYLPLDDLLQQSDFVSLHVPLTRETYHMIDARRLRMLKSEAILINTSRGPVVDETALVTCLKERCIRGAGLDVYENEPQVPEALKRLDNCVLLPHIGSATEEARFKMAEILRDGLVDFFEGRRPHTLIPEWKRFLTS